MSDLPPKTLVRQFDTHRLIPSHYSLPGGASVLTLIAEDDAHLADIFDLYHATNERLAAENDLAPGIGAAELLAGVPFFRIVNAAFCHPHPLGSRFNGPDRGAWYAGFAIETALHWLRDYRFDGLRLDAVHAIVERGEPDILEALSREVGELAARAKISL